MSDWLTTLGDVPPEEPTPVVQPKKMKRGRRGPKQNAAKKAEEEAKAKEEEKAKEGDMPKSPTKKHDVEKKLEPFYGRIGEFYSFLLFHALIALLHFLRLSCLCVVREFDILKDERKTRHYSRKKIDVATTV